MLLEILSSTLLKQQVQQQRRSSYSCHRYYVINSISVLPTSCTCTSATPTVKNHHRYYHNNNNHHHQQRQRQRQHSVSLHHYAKTSVDGVLLLGQYRRRHQHQQQQQQYQQKRIYNTDGSRTDNQIKNYQNNNNNDDSVDSSNDNDSTLDRSSITPTPTADAVANVNDIYSTSSSTGTNITSWKILGGYFELAKGKLSLLVVSTTAAGYIAAGPIGFLSSSSSSSCIDGTTPASYTVFALCLLGTALCSSSAAGLNQIIEMKHDIKMKRTMNRPLINKPIPILSKQSALYVSTAWGIAGTSLLYYGTDPITASLGLFNIILYAGVYTALKPISIYNTWVGAVVGAIPPYMGWTAATATATAAGMVAGFDPCLYVAYNMPGLLLASTLYCWQLPHFMALSYMHRIDYKRGGFQMLPVVDNNFDTVDHPIDDNINKNHNHNNSNTTIIDNTIDEDVTKYSNVVQKQQMQQQPNRTASVIVRYTWYLTALPFIASITDVTHSMFALEGIVFNAYALHVAYKFYYNHTNANARHVFLTSLWYLPCFLMLFLLHSKTYDTITTESDTRSTIVTSPTTISTNHNAKEENIYTNNTNILSRYIHFIRNKGRELCIHEQQASIATAASASGTNTNRTGTTNTIKTNNTTKDDIILCPVTILGSRKLTDTSSNVVAIVLTERQEQEQQQQKQNENNGMD